MTPHDKLRKRLNAYREAKALYESPDPHDREEARYEAMRIAGGRIGHDEAMAQAILDEYDLLDERLGLAYPRALQAAAHLVLNVDHVPSCGDDELDIPRFCEDLADAILELTEEQIETHEDMP